MIRRYQAVACFAVLVAVGAFGLLVLASFEYVSDLRFGDVALWPLVVGVLLVSIFITSWAIAKAKGRSGWLGLILPFLDVFGLTALFQLQVRGTKSAPRDRGL